MSYPEEMMEAIELGIDTLPDFIEDHIEDKMDRAAEKGGKAIPTYPTWKPIPVTTNAHFRRQECQSLHGDELWQTGL